VGLDLFGDREHGAQVHLPTTWRIDVTPQEKRKLSLSKGRSSFASANVSQISEVVR